MGKRRSRFRATEEPELPLRATPKKRLSSVLEPAAAAKLAVARRAKPSSVPDHVRLVLTIELRRELAERLSETGHSIRAEHLGHRHCSTGGGSEEMAMTDAQLRARIRELIASDDLPSEQPVIQNAGPGFGNFKRGWPCLICGEPDAMVADFWVGGRVAYLHAACDAVWMQEREKT